MPSCPICGASEANPHYGGVSCRACAVFFRRNCLLNKKISLCTCATREVNSHPCRECRMKKCMAIGMQKSSEFTWILLTDASRPLEPTRLLLLDPSRAQPDAVLDIQINREKTGNSKNDSLMTMSLVNPYRIIPRDSPHITSAKALNLLPSHEKKRMELYGGDGTKWNIYDLTSCVKKDSETVWSIVSNLFPQVHDLKYYDKDSLLSNFIPKGCKLESAIDVSRNSSRWLDSKSFMNEWICQFYKFRDGNALSSREIIQKFCRFWTYYDQNVITPIVCQQFDDTEFLAIVLLLFFDNGYTNITEKCAEMCQDIRKVILRELRAYQRDITDDDDDGDKRFLSTMEVPLIFEKCEKVFEEEMLVSEMHHVKFHEDFLEVIRRHNL